MRTIKSRVAGLVAGALVVLTWSYPAVGDQSTAAYRQKTFNGKVTTVNEKERTISAKGTLFTRTFNIADNCSVSFENKPQVSWVDLRPGQRVKIHYEDAHGVLITHQIAQRNIVFNGYITTIDPTNRTLAVKHGLFSRSFTIAGDCAILIKGEKPGTLDGLKVGHTVKVAYEKEDAHLVTHRIEHRDLMFAGTIRAIDAEARTVKARDFLDEKKFHLADGCRIVIIGKRNGDLGDLRIGERVVFSYEDANGILVANRVGRETASRDTLNAREAKAGDR